MSDYERIADVIEYLNVRRRRQPSLLELAERVGLSPFHFQRLFVRWAGVTPKKFLQCLTVEAAKRRLAEGRSVLEASLDTGLSGPGRLHDLTVSLEAASPGEIKSGGDGWTLTVGFADSPFGSCMIAESPRGICRMMFVEGCDQADAASLLGMDWPRAELQFDNRRADELASRIFRPNASKGNASSLRCLVKGTKFQTSVWRALLRVPQGQLTTYGRIAESIGKPKAFRAVGSAVGANPIAYLIPCHRVIRDTGVIGEYRWGSTRKTAMIGNELCREQQPHAVGNGL